MKTLETAALNVGLTLPFSATVALRLGSIGFDCDIRIHGVSLTTGVALPAASYYLNVFCGLADAANQAIITVGNIAGPRVKGIHLIHSTARNIGSTDNIILSKTSGISFDDSIPMIVRSGTQLGIYAYGTTVFNPPPGDNYLGNATAIWYYSIL